MTYKKDNLIDNDGFNNPNCKLTLEDRIRAKQMRAEGCSYRAIANALECSHTQVRRILEPAQPRWVYEIVNKETLTVEHVGESCDPKKRFSRHKAKVVNSNGDQGLFYGREDICLHVHPEIYYSQVDSIEAQRQLQIKRGLPTDNEKWSRGVRNGVAQRKLTDAEVLQIRANKAADPTITNVQLAKMFGVDYRTIGNIINRKTRIKI
jgi:DNA invertase Pin-like site-specific DNA recombinase